MIKTNRLTLRKFTKDDAKIVSYNSQRPSVAHFMSDMILEDEKSAVEWIEWINGRFNTSESFLAFAIERNEDKICIGFIAIAPKAELNNEIEIVFLIADEYQNKGYASEAGKAIISWAFENCTLDYLVAIVKTDNVASQRVIEKIGYIRIDEREIEYDGDLVVFQYYRLYRPK